MRARVAASVFAFAAVAAGALASGCIDVASLKSERDDDGAAAAVREAGAPAEGGAASGGEASLPEASRGDGPSWELYTFNPFPSVQAWSHAPLAGVWAGEHAPPPRDVLATTMLSRFRRLLVASGDRRLYELGDDDEWRVPREIDQAFPLLAGKPLDGLLHVESTPDYDGGPPFESIYWYSGHEAFLYEMLANDAVKYHSRAALSDEDGGPPRSQATLEWGFTVFDDTKYPSQCDWAQIFLAYQGSLYVQSACFSWTRYAPGDMPAWAGKPSAPDFSRVRAAYVDTKSGNYNLIVEP